MAASYKDFNHVFYFIVALAWNDIDSNDQETDPLNPYEQRKKKYNSLTVKQQEELIVLKCDEWIPLFFSTRLSCAHVPRSAELTK